MRGIILLDGPDGAGKTSLAEKLLARVETSGAKGLICHLGKPDKGKAWDQQAEALINYMKDAFIGDQVIIADRHFLSESIYGYSYREGSEYPFAARHVDRLLARCRALRVICAPPVDVVVENHARLKEVRFEEYDSGMDKVAQRYIDLWCGATGHTSEKSGKWLYSAQSDYIQQLTVYGGVADKAGWYHYDFTKHGAGDHFANFLLNELEVEQDLIPEDLLDVEKFVFTGFPHEQAVLFVGDRTDSPHGIPFFGNEGGNHFIARQFNDIGLNENKVVMVDICETQSVGTTRALSELCRKTVALSREAERRMMLYGIPVDARLRHPREAHRYTHFEGAYQRELLSVVGDMPSVLISST